MPAPVGQLFPATITRIDGGVVHVHAPGLALGREFPAPAGVVVAGWTPAVGDRVLIGLLAGLVDQVVVIGPLTGA